MREILFKAKELDSQEWVIGSLVKLSEYDYRIVSESDVYWAYTGYGDYEGTMTKIDSNTICQYTGLTDKNGNKIWENDICDRKEKYPEVVKQYQGDWVLDYSYVLGKEEGNNYCNLGFYCCERNCVEVIGNIFDNPELIGEQNG